MNRGHTKRKKWIRNQSPKPEVQNLISGCLTSLIIVLDLLLYQEALHSGMGCDQVKPVEWIWKFFNTYFPFIWRQMHQDRLCPECSLWDMNGFWRVANVICQVTCIYIVKYVQHQLWHPIYLTRYSTGKPISNVFSLIVSFY